MPTPELMPNTRTQKAVVTEMATFRLPIATIDHLDHAHKKSELTKTVLVRRALEEYLSKHYPLPEASTAQTVH